ncbi:MULTISPECIES: hypothetical protein [unclassified Frankia]|uniref:hypothetical protein n=1 Tax=unclassified Frankia TaxID=2632575 RepID=UPI002024A1B9
MRAPRRRRPRSSTKLIAADPGYLAALAARVSYTPSPEHKDYLTSAGPGKLRSDASACPRDLVLDDVAKWLYDAVRAGNVSAHVEGDFPRYVWTRVGERVYEARLCNSGSGEYKGYPILPAEAPGWLP